MRGCFICGNNKKNGLFTVGVWQATGNLNHIGLGSVDPTDGQICCSFREGEFATVEQAKEAAQEVNPQEYYYDRACEAGYEEDYGPPDSDPYDHDRYDW